MSSYLKPKTIGGRAVHPLGIGTWGIGGDRLEDGNVFADYRRDEEAASALRYSISRGQNHIDTAQFYGAGHTEEVVGRAIRGLDRSSLFLATKVWRSHSLRHAVPRSVEDSLRRLDTGYVDLLYVHAPWDAIDMHEYIGGLNDAVGNGLARSIAVSNFNLEQLMQAMKISRHPIVANQLLYNVIERGLVTEETLRFCRSEGVTIVAYRPVARSMLTGTVENKTVAAIVRKYGRPASHIALNWLLSQDGVVAIPKATRNDHIDENLGACDFSMEESDIERLNRIGL